MACFSGLTSAVTGSGVILSGYLGAGTISPTGSTVTVTINSVVETAVVGANGSFSATFPTSSLAVGGPHTVT